MASIVGCIEAITQRTGGNPHRMATSAKPLLSLWRQTGSTPAEFAADMALVAEAARDCPAPIFARDIRAEGWAQGTDRRHSCSTLSVQVRWDDRLAAARAWAAAGRPRTVAAAPAVDDEASRKAARAADDARLLAALQRSRERRKAANSRPDAPNLFIIGGGE